MCEHGYTPRIKRIGIPDAFIEYGSIPELFQQCGMDAESILKVIRQSWKRNEPITEKPWESLLQVQERSALIWCPD